MGGLVYGGGSVASGFLRGVAAPIATQIDLRAGTETGTVLVSKILRRERGAVIHLVQALKDIIASGDQKYPIYVALMRAEVISKIAQVPNYDESTGNAQIARNVSTVPVKEWQRPRIPVKIEAIRRR